MGRSENGTVKIEVDEIKKETEKAFLCLIDGAEIWLPKSQIISEHVEGDVEVTMEITRWIAEQKELL